MILAGLRACATMSLVAVAFAAAASAEIQSQGPPVGFLDVPYIQQSEALCGGAAAAMVMRYWGATNIYAESFAPLVDEAVRGIRADDLLADLRSRGWNVRSFRGDRALVLDRLADGQPVIALVEDRPGWFHFVVVLAWTKDRVVYHDPARAPFRVVAQDAFEAAWAKSSHWTMLALPPEGGVEPVRAVDSEARRSSNPAPCSEMVAEGVRAAGAGEKAAALETFTTAAALCPVSSAPLREAAGVFALDGNWMEAARLAREAVTRDRADGHAWRILATASYVLGDPEEALAAWNAVGEPVIDLVTVSGLDRTRHSAATASLGLEPRTPLTAASLEAARKRLSDLPVAEAARVIYRPLGNGMANVEAVVVERPLFPTSRMAIASTAVRVVADRELAGGVAGLSGGGDLFTASWRWWAHRPRVAVSYSAPSRLGVWRAEVYGEEQTYGTGAPDVVESRRGGSLALSQWTTTLTRWQIGVGLDSWKGRGRTASFAAAVDQRLLEDRMSLRAHGALLSGSFRSGTIGVGAEARSRVRNEGTVVLGRVGFDTTSTDAPLALWPGAGTGHARTAVLRAHPLLDDGRITGEVFGRRLLHGTAEARRWLKPVLKIVRIAPAMFVDIASAQERLEPGQAWHADVGAGLRIAIPGSRVLRLDVAKGLRDGSTAVSIAWERE